MHAYVLKRTQACMGGAPGPGQVDKAEGYPGPQVAGPRPMSQAREVNLEATRPGGGGGAEPRPLEHIWCIYT